MCLFSATVIMQHTYKLLKFWIIKKEYNDIYCVHVLVEAGPESETSWLMNRPRLEGVRTALSPTGKT